MARPSPLPFRYFQNDKAMPNPCAAANPAGASRLQSLRPVRRVAELGALLRLRSLSEVVPIGELIGDHPYHRVNLGA